MGKEIPKGQLRGRYITLVKNTTYAIIPLYMLCFFCLYIDRESVTVDFKHVAGDLYTYMREI